EIAGRLPYRFRRRTVDLEEAQGVESAKRASVEEAQTARLVSTVVRRYIDGLPETERTILKLRFDADMSVAQISRSLRLDQQWLYRWFYKCFGELRVDLERAGVAASDVAEIIGIDLADLDFELKKRSTGPSNDGESGGADRQEETP
ncbi:MAG TPA: sigma factor-like helix-turn-helix DNA-binding protein, partial [Thermoanaerobaculia bacterium]|nr:sigma factor-like helix-turn-helix DNA-binding protein [Thermoanaerobaculia bacterium]